MPHLTIQMTICDFSVPCELCGEATPPSDGPRLVVDGGQAVVCRSCGKKHAPSLAALLDLERVAQRVGRIRRHTLVPPFEALLDLARAAEVYTASAGEFGKRVA